MFDTINRRFNESVRPEEENSWGQNGWRKFKEEMKKVIETLKTLAADAGSRITFSLIKESTKKFYKRFVKGTAKVAGAEVLEKVSKAPAWLSAVGIEAIETAFGFYEIVQLFKSRKAGEITKKDFMKCTTQRVSEGVFRGGAVICMSFVGSLLGSVVPVIGTAIGGIAGILLGGIIEGIGSLIGKACGSRFGRWLGRKLFG